VKKTDLQIYREARVERVLAGSNNYWVSIQGIKGLREVKNFTALKPGQELSVYWKYGRWIIHHIEPVKG
jgi:hypothetical protein